jgi:beta-lactamase regulating signal transducer with metallopeptidase domain
MAHSMAWIEMLGWMLIHSVWLIAVIVGAAWITLCCLRRRSANARYLVGCVAMTLSVLTLPASLAWSRAHQRIVPEPMPTVAPMVKLILPNSIGSPTGEVIAQATESSAGALAEDPGRGPDINADLAQSVTKPAATMIPPIDEVTAIEQIETQLRPHLWILVIGWLTGMLVLSLRPFIGWQVARRLRKVGLSNVPLSVTQSLRELVKCLGLAQSVGIFQSSLVQIPCVVGAWKPVILLPATAVTGLSVEQLEAVLVHELAHIRRHDYLINVLQTVVETLLFYHPAIWWVSRQIRVEREHCCDDLVVISLANRTEYCRALLAVEELRGRNRTPLLVLGSTGGSLLSRVRRIAGIDSDRSLTRLSDRWSLSLLGFVFMSGVCALLMSTSLVAKDSSFSVQLPDGGAIELLGVSTGEKLAPWWSPDGTPLADSPLQFSSQHPAHSMFTHVASECRSFAVRFRGMRPDLAVRRIFVENIPQSVGSGGGGPDVFEEIVTSGPVSKLDTTTIRVGFGQGEVYPPQAVSMAAQKLPSTLPAHMKPWYDAVTPTQIDGNNRKTQLRFKLLDTQFVYHEVEWSAVDIERERTIVKAGKYIDSGIVEFDLPSPQVSRIEYRLKTCKHWVRFENVSLQRGRKTDVKISTADWPPPKPDHYVAQVADGITVELVGVSAMEKEPTAWWKPDGRKLAVVPEHDSGLMQQSGGSAGKGAKLRRVLLHVYGARSCQNVILKMMGTRRDQKTNSGEPYVSYVGALNVLADGKCPPIEVGMATEPLSVIRTIDVGGKPIPAVQIDPEKPAPDDLQIESIDHPKNSTAVKNGLPTPESGERKAENDRRRGQTQVTWTAPNQWKQIDLEMTLFDVDGKSHRSISHESVAGTDEMQRQQIMRGCQVFDVATSRTGRIEYRYRVYQHWATFENVAVDPNKPTLVSSRTSTIELPGLQPAQDAIPISDDEKAVSKLEVIFAEKLSSRILPALAVTTGKATYAITTYPSCLVPDGTGHACDGNILELAGNAIDMQYEIRDTKELRVCRAPGRLTQFQFKDPVKLSVGDVLSSVNEQVPGGKWRVRANAAAVTSLNGLSEIKLTSGVHNKFSQLVQLDRCLPEGTILFKEGRLAGITLMGTRFLGADSRKSYAVPAERIAELVATLQRSDDAEPAAIAVPPVPAEKSQKMTSRIAEPQNSLEFKTEVPGTQEILAGQNPPEQLPLEGRVVDAQDRPISNAVVCVPVVDSDEEMYRDVRVGLSDQQGHFRINVPAPWAHRSKANHTVWAGANWHHVQILTLPTLDNNRGSWPKESLILKLPTTVGTKMRIVAGEVPQADVQVAAEVYVDHIEKEGTQTINHFSPVPRELGSMVMGKTDVNGNVILQGISSGRLYRIRIQSAKYGTQSLLLHKDKHSEPDRTYQVEVQPVGKLEGRVISNGATKVDGIRISVNFRDQDFDSSDHSVASHLCITDQEGRFSFPLTSGDAELSAEVKPGSPYFFRHTRKVHMDWNKDVSVDLHLELPVPVEGKLISREGKRPLIGEIVTVSSDAGSGYQVVRTDHEGRFRAKALAGSVEITPRGWKITSQPEKVVVPSQSTVLTMPTLEVTRQKPMEK